MIKKQRDEGPTQEQIKELLQQSILRHYPNPDRKGCLDKETIASIAEQSLPHQDARWEHISHCSPCYRGFLDHRQEVKAVLQQVIFRRRLVKWGRIGALALLGLSAIATLIKTH